jgi:NAD dependent epimerase/dehydratase family
MTLLGDVTDGAQVFNAMTTHFSREGLQAGKGPAPVEAVVHVAAVPRILINPDNEAYRVNVMGTYNVIEAAMKLGIRKVIIASSETTYGVCFAEGDKCSLGVPDWLRRGRVEPKREGAGAPSLIGPGRRSGAVPECRLHVVIAHQLQPRPGGCRPVAEGGRQFHGRRLDVGGGTGPAPEIAAARAGPRDDEQRQGRRKECAPVMRPREPGRFLLGAGRRCRDHLPHHLGLCGRIDWLPCRLDAREEGAQRF